MGWATPPFTTRQDHALVLLPKIMSVPSLIACGIILENVLRSKKRRRTVYHRLLVGNSVHDMLFAVNNIIGTWANPKGGGMFWLAAGTQHTCTTMAFLRHGALLTTILYSACLTLFFLLVVSYNWKERSLQTKVEPYLHLVANGVGWGTAVSGIFLKLYAPFPWGCGIIATPPACTQTYQSSLPENPPNCIRGDNAGIYTWLYLNVWVIATFFFMTISMRLMYQNIRKKECKNKRNSFQFLITNYPHTTKTMTGGNRSDSSRDDGSLQKPEEQIHDKDAVLNNQQDTHDNNLQQQMISTTTATPSSMPIHQQEQTEETPQQQPEEQQHQQIQQQQEEQQQQPQPQQPKQKEAEHKEIEQPPQPKKKQRLSFRTPTPRSSSTRSLQRWLLLGGGGRNLSETKRNRRKHHAKSNEFAKQAGLYCITFFFTFFFGIVNIMLVNFSKDGMPNYLFMVIQTVLGSLRGFFNFIIYIRPRYISYWKRKEKQRLREQKLQEQIQQQHHHSNDNNDPLKSHHTHNYSKDTNNPKFHALQLLFHHSRAFINHNNSSSFLSKNNNSKDTDRNEQQQEELQDGDDENDDASLEENLNAAAVAVSYFGCGDSAGLQQQQQHQDDSYTNNNNNMSHNHRPSIDNNGKNNNHSRVPTKNKKDDTYKEQEDDDDDDGDDDDEDYLA